MNFFLKQEKIKNYNYNIVFYMLFILLFFYTTISLILKYLNFDFHALDTGLQARVARNAFFTGSFYDEVLRMNLLGEHFSPGLAILGILFLIWDNFLILILFQNFCVFLTAYIGYKIARKLFNNPIHSIILFFLFVINNYTTNINLFEYHVETAAMPIYLTMFYLILNENNFKNRILIILLSMLGILIKEDVILTMAAFGLWILLFKKEYRLEGLLIFLINMVAFFLVVGFIMPNFSKGTLMHLYRYSYIGNSPAEIIKVLILEPWKIFIFLFSPTEKITYLRRLFEAFLFLPLLAPVQFLLSLLMIIFHLLSTYKPQNELCCQYSVSIIPFLYIASIYGINNIIKIGEKFFKIKNNIHILISGFVLITLILNGDVRNFVNRYKNYYKFNIEKYFELEKKVKPLLDKKSRIYVDEQLYPYLIQYNIGLFKYGEELASDCEYLVIAFETGFNWGWEESKEYRNYIESLFKKYNVIYKSDNFVIIKVKN